MIEIFECVVEKYGVIVEIELICVYNVFKLEEDNVYI